MESFWTVYDQKNVKEIATALARLVAEREAQNSDFRVIRDDGKLVAEAQTASAAAETYSKLAHFFVHLYLGTRRVAEMTSGERIKVRKPK